MYLLIDGTNMAHRARHAYQLSYRGRDTSVTYGVMRMLMALVKKHKPVGVVFAWDGGTPGFRRRLVPTYKTNRKRDDTDPSWISFLSQLNELERILPSTGVLQVRRRGIEADDLIAQAAIMAVDDCLIISNDDDLLQCVDEGVSVLKPGKKDVVYDIDNFEELVGYPVYQFVAAKVLQGDSSDNIPGVHGIGPKTAQKIFSGPHGNASIANLTGRLRERTMEFIEDGKYNASYTAIDLSEDRTGARRVLLEAEWQPYDNKAVMSWCIKYGFTSIIEAGSLGLLFGPMKKPVFDAEELRVPRVWDYGREMG